MPLYHGGTLVGLWSVRHSDPDMYRQSDGDLLELLAPQLALMVAIDGSLRPVTGASDQTTQYVQTLRTATEEIHASSQEVTTSAQRARQGAALVGIGAGEVFHLDRGTPGRKHAAFAERQRRVARIAAEGISSEACCAGA